MFGGLIIPGLFNGQPVKYAWRNFTPPRGKASVGLVLLWCLLLCGCSTVPERFQPSQPIPSESLSHADLDGVLKTHVRDGVVDYPRITRDPRLPRYLELLDRVNPDTISDLDARLAFWINAYNALAIQGVLNGITPETWPDKYRFFIGTKFRIGGGAVNLWGLEHDILIPLGEPRIHFAIVCASASCPKLRNTAYAPETLEAELDDAARRFVNDDTRNRFDRAGGTAYLSQIFKWFRDDFEAEAGSLSGYIARYVNDPVHAAALAQGVYRIEFLDYDWRPNGPLP